MKPHGDDSLAADPDPEVAKKIREGFRRQAEDQRAMEEWARGGFSSWPNEGED
jgi:hypothetical protein